MESTRPVRFLLIRGANKTIIDNNGNAPIDLVNNGEVTTPAYITDLKKMLGDPNCCDCLMLSAPTRMTQRRPTTLLIYLLMNFGVLTIESMFIFPYLEAPQTYTNLGVLLICLIFFTLSACIQPGYLVNENVDFYEMLTKVDST